MTERRFKGVNKIAFAASLQDLKIKIGKSVGPEKVKKLKRHGNPTSGNWNCRGKENKKHYDSGGRVKA